MFEKHRQEKAAKEYAEAVATWEREDDTLKGLLSVISKGGGPDGGGPVEVPLVLKKAEHSVFVLTGGGLFEPRRGPGHYAGRSSGFSIPLGSTGVRYRIGASRGTFVQGDENPTIIDTGTAVVTDQRVVFMGSRRTVEWAFTKLVAIQHYENRPWTAIQVSNRQKVTGITYDAAHQQNLRLRLEAALALFNRDTAELSSQLRTAISAHDGARPRMAVTPASGPPSKVETQWPASGTQIGPAGAPGGEPTPLPLPNWYPDPERRHQYRYWDGTRWSDEVADAGVQGIDRSGGT